MLIATLTFFAKAFMKLVGVIATLGLIELPIWLLLTCIRDLGPGPIDE